MPVKRSLLVLKNNGKHFIFLLEHIQYTFEHEKLIYSIHIFKVYII